MVDKIDRPKPPEPWQVRATAESRERDQEGRQPFQDDEFSSPGSADKWKALHQQRGLQKIVQLHRTEIRHVWFRKATLLHQSAMVECDLEMVNGTLYRGAQCLLPRMDDYFQLKGYSPGQEIAVTEIFHEPIVEISIPEPTSNPRYRPVATTTATTTESTTAWWSLWDMRRGTLRPVGMLLYGLGMAVLIAIVLLLI
ncbi:MAG: hypothetical protein HYV02_02515 [Deltaproteobacteria bacterium]|nr:hypothetical protein [Deltaproteobacteria bacterium]